MPQKKSGIRIIISSGILTTMFMGLCGFVYGELKRIPLIENKQYEYDRKQVSIEQKINEIHWYLIRDKRVDIPNGDRINK